MLNYNGIRYKTNESVICYDMEDEAVLHNIVTKQIIVINRIGWLVWTILDNDELNTMYELESKISSQVMIEDRDVDLMSDISCFIDNLISCNALMKAEDL